MARKGSRKVRTGCFTCKVRKVKCDETKPECRRCSTSGRKCDGFPAPHTAELRPLIPQPLSMFPGVNSQTESRSLQFFFEMAGPSLPGATDPFFWTHLVMQFSRFEPAVKHSLIAISSLYEVVNRDLSAGPSILRSRRLQDNNLALHHYNAAIKELVTMKNPGLVLLVCLLFVCIELLQSNRENALRHCAHGNAILSSSDSASYHWVRQWLAPIFRRLTALQYFFGVDRSDLPDLTVSEFETPAMFSNFTDAQAMMDSVFNQAFRLIRLGEKYRVGNKRHEEPPPELLKEQERIASLLDLWYTMLHNFEERSKTARNATKEAPRMFALARYRVCRIWSSMAFNASEMGYDDHFEDFQLMAEELKRAADERNQKGATRKAFEFEMGFIAPISFIAIKCRYLDLRLEALRCLKILAAPREALWQRDGMFAIARRMVEIEHGICLDGEGRRIPGEEASCPGLPPDEERIVHFTSEFLEGRQESFHGHEVRGRKVVFLFRTADDKIVLRPEILGGEPMPLPAWSPASTDSSVLSSPGTEDSIHMSPAAEASFDS